MMEKYQNIMQGVSVLKTLNKRGRCCGQGAGNEIKLSCLVLSFELQLYYTAKVFFFFLPKALTAHGTIFKDLSHSQKY